MAVDNGKMTWERWKALTPEQREWEHFSYHDRLEDRLCLLEGSRIKRGVSHFLGSLIGGAGAVVGYLLVFKDLCK